MSRDDDKLWRELLLGYEELDAERRREVDAYLARNADARERLERLRELERRAVEPMGAISLDPAGMDALSGEQVAAERRSREALLAQLGVSENEVPRRVNRGRASRRWRLWLPAAAAAAALLLLLGPWNDAGGPGLSGLEVVRLDNGRQTRSTARETWLRTGDAFALSFELQNEASVIVYHIDPEGQVDLVLPGAPDQPAPRLTAGTVRIPGIEAPEQWVLGGSPGRESFVVGVSEGPVAALAELDTALRERLAASADRDDAIRLVRSFLRSRMDSVAVTEIDHRP